MLFWTSCANSQVDPESSIKNSPTSILGFNHIGISVNNLDEMIAFYQGATGFEMIKREKVYGSKNADLLYGKDNVSYETATLRGPNMLLELTEFDHQIPASLKKMPPQGPGMTHTCYQTPDWHSGYEKFKDIGAEVLSRGDDPVDLGGYGVTYAYAYDPDGNMLELEQVARHSLTIDSAWIESNPMWMTQVALISPNLNQLATFYQNILDILPYRKGDYKNLPRLDDLIDHDSTSLLATWFRMDGVNKMLELMQYRHPMTPNEIVQRHPIDLGYSFSFEVGNIQEEYRRMSDLGVVFLSEPLIMGEFWTVFANDIDGNVFSLRQPVSSESMHSILNFMEH